MEHSDVMKAPFKFGLYRHFKGGYYLVMNRLLNDGEEYVQYIDVLHIERGYFCRPVEEFSEDVSDRKDNYTGQLHRFEYVTHLDDVVKNASTEQLVKELKGRADSPLQTLDIDGLNERVYSTDYVIGIPFEATEDTPKCVETLNVFDTVEEAWECLKNKKSPIGVTVFKRTFIEEEHF